MMNPPTDLLAGLPDWPGWMGSADSIQLLEKASRAIGRLEQAHRDLLPSHAGLWHSMLYEAHASATLAFGEVDKVRTRTLFASGRPWGPVMHDGPSAAAGLLQLMTGLGPYPVRLDADPFARDLKVMLDSHPSAFHRDGVLPRDRVRSFIGDVANFVATSAGPALVKASTVMLAAHASAPQDALTGVASRQLFSRVLVESGGCEPFWVPPVSWGLLAERSAGEATGKQGPRGVANETGQHDDVAIVLSAVARSATTMTYFIDGLVRDVRAFESALANEGRTLTSAERRVVDTLIGLRTMNVEQLGILAGVGRRTTRRIVDALEAARLVAVRTTSTGSSPTVIRVRGAFAHPRLEAVAYYPIPGEPWPAVA